MKIENIIQNVQLFRLYNLEISEAADFKKIYADFYKKHRRHRFFEQNSNWLPKVIVALMMVLTWMVGSKVVIDSPSTLSVGGLIVIIDVVNKFGKASRYVVKAVFSII